MASVKTTSGVVTKRIPRFSAAVFPAVGLVEYGGLRPVRKAFVGTVVAAVRHPKYMQFVGRIVQSKAVAHFLIYDVFFVVGGDEQRQVGEGVICRWGVAAVLRKHSFSLTRA